MIPEKMTVVSDGNELVFKRTEKAKNETIFVYEYTKSKTRNGMELRLTEEALKKYLSDNIFKINQTENETEKI